MPKGLVKQNKFIEDSSDKKSKSMMATDSKTKFRISSKTGLITVACYSNNGTTVRHIDPRYAEQYYGQRKIPAYKSTRFGSDLNSTLGGRGGSWSLSGKEWTRVDVFKDEDGDFFYFVAGPNGTSEKKYIKSQNLRTL
jgi:hypothetical protein